MKINDELIVNFRKNVNSNSGFVYQTYHNINGKNLWGLICSCMDWISVAIRFLSKHPRFHKDIDVRVMQLYSYISAIDIVFEAINQLDRAILKSSQIPFDGKSAVFKNNILGLDDNNYFKEIRAMFGAHPVNLNHKDKKKWYASWPYDLFTTNKSFFEIMLYSNQIGEKDLTFNVNINDLNSFLIERYEYLNTLIDAIDKQYEDFRKSYINQKIVAVGTPIEILNVLRAESRKRLNTDYYNSTIDELIRIFSTTINDESLIYEELEYKNELLLLIDEIKDNLQAMNLVDLVNDKVLNPEYPDPNLGYSISKLYSCDFKYSHDPLFNFHMKELDRFSNSRYNFCNTSDPDVILLKMKIMLYSAIKREEFS